MRLQLNIDCPPSKLFAGGTPIDGALYELLKNRLVHAEDWKDSYIDIKVNGKLFLTSIKPPRFESMGKETSEISGAVVTAQLLGDIDLIDEDGEIICRIR